MNYTLIKNLILLAVVTLAAPSLFTSCGMDIEVKGGTEHVVKIDEATLEAIREVCRNAEQQKEEDCVQQLIDAVTRTETVDASKL